jgi:predicted acyltransferase
MNNAAVVGKILRRTLLIFLLGYLMYWFPFFRIDDAGHITSAPFFETRIMGVLQRIALCYGFAALMIHFLSTRSVIILSIIFLFGYWLLLLLFGDSADPLSMLGNTGTYIDKFILGDSHLYHGEGVAFDPEGLLSTIPAIVNVVIGYFAGKYIQEKGKAYETISKLLLAGCALIFIALCWDMVFPINKKLWSSSFVLLTTGIDLVIIAALIYILELKFWNPLNWTRFFTIFGKNPLFIYLLSELLITVVYMIRMPSGDNLHQWINKVFFQAIVPGAFGSFLFAIFYMLVCWVIGYILDKRKIYLRV